MIHIRKVFLEFPVCLIERSEPFITKLTIAPCKQNAKCANRMQQWS